MAGDLKSKSSDEHASATDLDHVVAHDHGEAGVDSGGHVGLLEVAGHERQVSDGKDALERAVALVAEGLVDLLRERLLLGLDDQVDDGHGGGGHAQRDSCEIMQGKGVRDKIPGNRAEEN